MKPQPVPKVSALVHAIDNMHVISFVYHGTRRIVQPQCYGIGKKGHELLRGYEPARIGETKEPLYTLAEMSELAVGNEHFTKPGPHYKKNDSAFAVIFAQL